MKIVLFGKQKYLSTHVAFSLVILLVVVILLKDEHYFQETILKT